MEFGFGIPTRGPMATPENIATLARKGEEMGFGIISVSDHVIIPKSIGSTYPYNESGTYMGGPSGECMEQLALLSFLAGVTSTAKLLTSVMVLPHRPPVLAAKMLATIDVLSNGRLIVGCGVGWMREEFEALGTPPYDERGAVGDEYIRAFKELWTSDNPEFEGEYCRFSEVSFAPKPVQKPHPPIWTGGESNPALRRAGRLADAWYPIGTNPRFTVGTPEQFAEYSSRVRRYAQEAGRDPNSLDFAYSAGWVNEQAQTLPGGERRPLTGTPQQIAGDVGRYEELGVRHMMVNLQGNTLEQTLERMERFADRIMPLAK
ncbi:MAG: LLM class F420-dependent oxidoreductase [Chloroflexi bacterium]|nr:LLM class F420-dependent oxidoreductase [Chloroflexota bacterium]